MSDLDKRDERWFLDDAWHRMAGVPMPVPKLVHSLEELRESEWCEEFEQLMRNRLVMGAFRYAPLAEQDLNSYDFIKEAIRRLSLYLETDNLEHLVDSANMVLIEFIKGQRLGKKVKPIDDGIHNEKKED